MRIFTNLRTACVLLACLLLGACATASGHDNREHVPIVEGKWVPVNVILDQPVPADYLAHVHSQGRSYDRVFVGSIRYNQFWLFVNGQQVLHGPLGTGSARNGYATTLGVHKIIRKEGPLYKSKTYPEPHGGAPMGFALFFTGDGQAVHASANYRTPISRVSRPGPEQMCVNCSHGCANLRYSDAQVVHMYLGIGDTVVILE